MRARLCRRVSRLAGSRVVSKGGSPPPRRARGLFAWRCACIDRSLLAPGAAMQEDGKLLYTSQAPDDGNEFDEPVDILPDVSAFTCHVDSMGNVHIHDISSKCAPDSRQPMRSKSQL